MAKVEFKDNSIKVKEALEEAAIAWLHEASGELQAQTKRNSRVKTGQLKSSWAYNVDKDKLESKIGSPLENAIWEEFGTGEFALKGNGRKKGWKYKDAKGNWHYTIGKRPNRTLYHAFESKKPKLIKSAQNKFKGIN